MKLIKVIPILLGALFLLGSCVKEEFPGDGSTPDGKPTLMKLSLKASFRDEMQPTRATLPEAEENKFKDVRVMIFKSSGEVVTNYKIVYPSATANPNIEVNTYSGSGRSVYIIANVVDDLDAKLLIVQTLDELNAIQTTATELGNGLTGKPLIMIGKLAMVDIAPGSNVIQNPIKMEYMSAKLTLKVVDNTPQDHTVILLGWDIENGPENSFLILDGGGSTRKDANDGKEQDNSAWVTTDESLMPFDKIEGKTATLTQYLFENRRGSRTNKPLPSNPYSGMNFNDGDHRGKAWFAPSRATCIVIHALHKTPTESKVIEARIFLGADNSQNYDISRGIDYQFTVTVNGIGHIDIDTNLKPTNGSFVVYHSAPLDQIDAHPDFRPFMIDAESGMATIEVLDSQGRAYGESGFDATWVKVSPLNLMYHQVKQAAPNDEWQQAGDVGDFVRGKYIPHKSVRAALVGIGGWNTVPVGKEDDDEMTFADATYRMCYKITEIPFAAGAVTNKTLCVYADEFISNGGTRSAQIKVLFKKDGLDVVEEKPVITITQNGYLTIFDMNNPDAGLNRFNEDGTPSSVKRKFVVEQYEEVDMQMNPGLDPSVQKTRAMQWGFDMVTPYYDKKDKYRNGYFLTAEAVYTDVTRTANEPTGFGMTSSSLKPKYGNGKTGGKGVIPNYGSGSHSRAPYYYPTVTNNIYHPIYKSSAARYCHEKNRDINGDGFIDASETKWYLPSEHELQMIWIANNIKSLFGDVYWSATQSSSLSSWGQSGSTAGKWFRANAYRVRCVREL